MKAFKKITFYLIVSTFTLIAAAQEKPTFNMTLFGFNRNGWEIPQLIDTVFLNNKSNKIEKFYTNIFIKDSSFIITDVPMGRHLLTFSTKNFCVSPVLVFICSKCENQFQFYAFNKKKDDDCSNYSRVEVWPVYNGGNKALSQQFKKCLTRSELKKLIKSNDYFTVHFYVTKKSEISDPEFIPTNISQEVKDIVLKGLKCLTNWRPAEINGIVSNYEYNLEKNTLLEN